MITLLFALSAPALAGVWPGENAPDEPWPQTEGGVSYLDLAAGEGQAAVDGASVEVHYTGFLEDGRVFDSSVKRGKTLSFLIGGHQVIPGWEEGVTGMKVGGKRRLIIPPKLGYGQRSAGPIPPGSTLYFEIEVFGIILPRVVPTAPGQVDPDSFKPQKSGLILADLVVGEGRKPKSGRRVCVDYTVWQDGKLIDHTFGSQTCRWFRYENSPVPPGLVEGMATMKTGGTRQMRIPAELLKDTPDVKKNGTLLYEVTLVEADE